MADVIDVNGLPDEQVKLIREFVRFLKQQANEPGSPIEEEETISFAEWTLGVKGRLTREEIYDYL
jgi:hypothetical protein